MRNPLIRSWSAWANGWASVGPCPSSKNSIFASTSATGQNLTTYLCVCHRSGILSTPAGRSHIGPQTPLVLSSSCAPHQKRLSVLLDTVRRTASHLLTEG